MNAEIVCIASSKGGSGKTMLTASIASFLNGIGKKCLVIDCDASTHGLTLLYLVEVSKNKHSLKKGLFQISSEYLLNERISTDATSLQKLLENSIISLENSIDILPATYNFSPNFDPEKSFEETSLLKILNKLKQKYDFIFLDAQAGSDKYSKLAMSKKISEKVILVSEYDPLSAAGIERLKQVVGNDLDYSRTWVLLNKMLPEFVDKFSEFLSITKYLPPIPWNADIVRAYSKRKLALNLKSGNTFTLAIMRTVSELFGENIEKEISNWKETQVYALKEPLKQQYENAEKELRYLIESKFKAQHENRRKKFLFLNVLLIPILMIPIVLKFFSMDILDNFVNLINFDSWTTITLISIVGIALTQISFFIYEKLLKFESSADYMRYNRKISVLQEELKKLETLKSANFETIIHNKA